MNLSLQQITEATQGRLLQGDPALRLAVVGTDSRAITPGSLFVALKGEKFDAHNFLGQATRDGAGALLVSDPPAEQLACPIVLVEDTLVALQALAAYWRKLWNGIVVALTGSNGKTSTKDFTRAVLGRKFRVHATQGNLNNHIGCPLTCLQVEETHEAAVVEIGMNHFGEIAPLARLAAPNVGIITNIGTAHIENLGSREGIAQEKGVLAEAIPSDGCVILNADDDFTPAIAQRCQAPVLRAGFAEDADVRVSAARSSGDGSHFTLHFPNGSVRPAHLPVPGRHMISNAALAAACGWHLGLAPTEIVEGLASVSLTKGRVQLKTVRGVTFLDDSYNANPDSMRAALETLLGFECSGRRVAVLGKMGELGPHSTAEHRSLGRAAEAAGIDLIVAVGDDDARLIVENLTGNAHHFATHADAALFLRKVLTPSDLVLVKGSRSASMEKVIEAYSH